VGILFEQPWIAGAPTGRVRHIVLLFAICVALVGCGRYSPAEVSQRSKAYIASWGTRDNSVPSIDSQVNFFRSHLNEAKDSLSGALENSSITTRMWATHVIGKIGPDAKSFEPRLAERVGVENSRVVRIYLYEALREIKASSPETVEVLTKQLHRDDGPESNPGLSAKWYYSPGDEAQEITKTLAALAGDQKATMAKSKGTE
jgi:hypothetical protein